MCSVVKYLDVCLLTLAELRFDPNFLYIPFICCCCINFDSYLLYSVSFYGESKFCISERKVNPCDF